MWFISPISCKLTKLTNELLCKVTTIAIPSVNIFVFLSIRFLNHFLGHAFLNTPLLRSGNKGHWFSLFKFNYISAGLLKEYLFLFNKVIFNKFCSSQINSQTPRCEWITSLLFSVPSTARERLLNSYPL